MKRTLLLVILVSFFACKDSQKHVTVEAIIQKTIAVACNGHCNEAEIHFTFRGIQYHSARNDGIFMLERNVKDSTGTMRDVITNSGFKRYHNGTVVALADTTALQLYNSVNSVHYFAQLPYGLDAPSVHAKLLGGDTIHGEHYYEVHVSFGQKGGGTDFQDTFLYWIHRENFTVDYLAYQYDVNGGGIRFREAYNPRRVKGIRFVDYNNFKPVEGKPDLADLDDLFQKSKLQLLSRIETEAVKVQLPQKD